MQRAEPQPPALVRRGNAHLWAESRYTMTNVEFMTAIVNTASLPADIRAYAQAQLDKNADKNAKRRTTPTAAQVANANLLTDLVGAMGAGEVLTAANAAVLLGVSVQKASALLQNGVKSGVLTKTEVKVKGKGKVCGYAKANPTTEDAPAEGDSAEVAEGNSESAE